MRVNFVKVAAMIGLASSLSVPSWGIITNGTVNMNETGQLDGIAFNVGSRRTVHDLNQGITTCKVGQEGVASSPSFRCTWHKPGDVNQGNGHLAFEAVARSGTR